MYAPTSSKRVTRAGVGTQKGVLTHSPTASRTRPGKL